MNAGAKKKVRQSPTKSGKKTAHRRMHTPEPMQERIRLLYAAGMSIRAIHRETKKDPDTISKIVHGPDMKRYVADMREKFFVVLPKALESVEFALETEQDGRLGYQVLKATGVIAGETEEKDQRATALDVPVITDQQKEEDGVKRVISLLTEQALQRSRLFGTKLPEVEEIEEELTKQNGGQQHVRVSRA